MCARQLNLSHRTLKRWKTDAAQNIEDRRPTAVRPKPKNALTEQEIQAVLDTCNSPKYASWSAMQIVTDLADQGVYLASTSTFLRILKKHLQNKYRGRAREPQASKPKATHTATAPNQVWVWDITWLPSTVTGLFYKCYMILDLYSRKIIDAEVWNEENAERSKTILQRAYLREKLALQDTPLVLHGDNGSPLKAQTVIALMDQLGITPSHSRPRVSNDNPHAEALFRTAKYHPSLPLAGFEDLEGARLWTENFRSWYNSCHRHSALKYVTPEEKHTRQDVAILAKRQEVYEKARKKNPERWIQNKIQDCSPVEQTTLNPIDIRKLERKIKRSA